MITYTFTASEIHTNIAERLSLPIPKNQIINAIHDLQIRLMVEYAIDNKIVSEVTMNEVQVAYTTVGRTWRSAMMNFIHNTPWAILRAFGDIESECHSGEAQVVIDFGDDQMSTVIDW